MRGGKTEAVNFDKQQMRSWGGGLDRKAAECAYYRKGGRRFCFHQGIRREPEKKTFLHDYAPGAFIARYAGSAPKACVGSAAKTGLPSKYIFFFKKKKKCVRPVGCTWDCRLYALFTDHNPLGNAVHVDRWNILLPTQSIESTNVYV